MHGANMEILNTTVTNENSGFRHSVNETFGLLGCYAELMGY